MPGPHFTPKTIPFLRALKRHNDREWFRERRAVYDEHVHAPMVAVIEQLARDFASFAPELVAEPRRSMHRIYRDTRFSADKSPLKTNVAASFPLRGETRHESAGLYFEVAHGWVWAGGGLYRPSSLSLYRVRQRVADNLPAFEQLIAAPAFRKQCGTLQGERLQRVPRPFRADHPAVAYLKHKQFLAWREFPADLAASPQFYPSVLRVFRALAPVVRFLNEAVEGRERRDTQALGSGL
jgi:uncharacterized protein (TIGR02453 family)